MDAKSKANFINSVADGQSVVCPQCGAQNQAGSKFCITCGQPIEAAKPADAAPAFAPAAEPEAAAAPEKKVKYVEPDNVFAQGLPDWSIEPPQVLVRRR